MKHNQLLRKTRDIADIMTNFWLLGIGVTSFNTMLDDLPVYL